MKKDFNVGLWIVAFLAITTSGFAEGPKQQIVTYKDRSSCVGYMQKDKFIDGPMELSLPGSIKLSGEYRIIHGLGHIQGEFRGPGVRYKGLFRVSNNESGLISPKVSAFNWSVYIPVSGIDQFQILNIVNSIKFSGCKNDSIPGTYRVVEVFRDNRIDSLIFHLNFEGNVPIYQTFLKSKPLDNSNSTSTLIPSPRGKKKEFSRLYKVFDLTYSNVIIYYSNQDQFKGEIHKEFESRPYPYKGIYKYKNGDRFSGTFMRQSEVPNNGEITYADGSSATGYIQEIWPNLPLPTVTTLCQKGCSLTEIRNHDSQEGKRIAEEKRQQELRLAAEKRAQEMRLAAEKRLAALKERKKQQEELQKQREEAARKERLRQSYIKKYGPHWGELVFKKELTFGMTPEMCADIVNKKAYSVSQYWSGLVEVWMLKPLGLALNGWLGEAYESLTFTRGELTGYTR